MCVSLRDRTPLEQMMGSPMCMSVDGDSPQVAFLHVPRTAETGSLHFWKQDADFHPAPPSLDCVAARKRDSREARDFAIVDTNRLYYLGLPLSAPEKREKEFDSSRVEQIYRTRA